MESKKILLIENQYRQFIKIKTYLNNVGYTVCPTDEVGDPFNEFIDYVRIYLNPRYGGIEEKSRRKEVIERIVKEINTEDFDALIIDYILVGNHVSKTGIFLAETLRDNKVTTPIIFLSREKSNQPKIINNLKEKLEPFEWIHKGYDGREILDEEYFNRYVIKGIQKCIGKSASQLLDEIAKSQTFNDYKKRINKIGRASCRERV